MELTRKIIANPIPPNNTEVLWLDTSTIPFLLKVFTLYGKWESITITNDDIKIVKNNVSKINELEAIIKNYNLKVLTDEQINNIVLITVARTLEALGINELSQNDEEINTPQEVYTLLKNFTTLDDLKTSTLGFVDENGIVRY